MLKITVVNGSLGGDKGNTGEVLRLLCKHLVPQAQITFVHLVSWMPGNLGALLEASNAFVFASGTYWDSWGSPLQRFLEELTPFEGSPALVGKPAAALVTMHSVGGKEVLSRLQGVLSTLGLGIPPMTGMVYSLANQLALESRSEFQSDLWELKDLETVAANLLTAAQAPPMPWKTWPVDKKEAKRLWITSQSAGSL